MCIYLYKKWAFCAHDFHNADNKSAFPIIKKAPVIVTFRDFLFEILFTSTYGQKDFQCLAEIPGNYLKLHS